MPDLAHDLASLMCSKLCHDLVSPIGALGNGIEVLADENDAELRDDALELIAHSAKSAAAKLQFARLAFGTAGGPGGTLDLGLAARAAKDYFETTKSSLDWDPGAQSADKDIVRLCLNLLLVALDCIPRGGEVRAALETEEGRTVFTAEATGRGARLAEPTRTALSGEIAQDQLDARSIQPFFTGHLAREISAVLTQQIDESRVCLKARL